MSPPFDHEMPFDDDDGMPPLVDNPLPPMTFTFATDLPPRGYSPDAAIGEFPQESNVSDMSMYASPDAPAFTPARGSHAKKRDSSYIPRPPNAFILFRSSFIRGQYIPGEIEGNHSALSKIIGKCWRALPREERQVWEAKAIVALAEHRKKYPDWRFKPAANALVKVKDGPRKRGSRKGRGQSEKEERSREKRCAKIADLLVAGKTGSDLAAAIEKYDCEVGRGRKLKDEGVSMDIAPQTRGNGDAGAVQNAPGKGLTVMGLQVPNTTTLSIATERMDVKPLAARSATDGRFKVPLTAMFKRSSSAPAPRARTPPDDLQISAGHRRDSFSATPPSLTRATSFDSIGITNEGTAGTGFGASREGTGHASADSVSSIQTFSPGVVAPPILLRNTDRGIIGANDVKLNVYNFNASAFSSPHLPAFELDLDGLSSPVQSPVATPVLYSWGQESDNGSPTSIADMMGEAYAPAPSPSSYSSLEGWAGSPLPQLASPISSPLAKVRPYVDSPSSPSVMEKAFDAAACAAYGGEWTEPLAFGLGAVGTAHAHSHLLYHPNPWGSETDSVLSYAPPIAHCRQDNF